MSNEDILTRAFDHGWSEKAVLAARRKVILRLLRPEAAARRSLAIAHEKKASRWK